jgi:cyclophilin family peptidyl-prolyl cis-trans isomerase
LLVAVPLGTRGAEPATKPGPQAAEFARVFTEWKELLTKMGALKEQYSTADAKQKADIQGQWKELVAKATTVEEQLVATSQKAYQEAPGADKQVTNLLVGLLMDWCQRDDYERAFAVGKLLMDHHCGDPQVPGFAGIAAFCVNEFDTAEDYFQQAKKLGKLNKIGQMDAENIDYYKTAWAKENKIRQAEAKADDLPRILLKTSQGDIELELFENEAPNSVANFVTLVEKGFYNGLAFHRVLANFMAQGGDPKGDGTGGPGYQIPCECYRTDFRQHFRGSLSMAHAGRDTGGSQFFLTFVPTTHLDGKHTVFGRVIKGQDVLAKLRRRDPGDPNAPLPDKIVEAKVLRKRPHPYEVKKLG